MDDREDVPLMKPKPRGIHQFTTSQAKWTAVAVILCLAFGVIQNMSSQPTITTPLEVSNMNEILSDPFQLNSFPGSQDEIVNLPGKPDNYTSKLYSGFLPLPNGGQIFYYLATSQSNTSATDPVLLWLNGGPGASSLFGCFSENGPLLLNDDGVSLRSNPYAWNRNSHLLCFESPVGVGFSYNTSNIYISDDFKQADDVYEALQTFFTKFPFLQPNSFIISGESYGGVYVPLSAKAIVEGNKERKENKVHINLQKFAIGNGVNEFAGFSQVLYAYYHGLIGGDEYQLVRETCPSFQEFQRTPKTLHPGCALQYMSIMQTLISAHINSYDIFRKCHGGDMNKGIDQLLKRLEKKRSTMVHHPYGLAIELCLNSTASLNYFNAPQVRDAMHAKVPFELKWSYIALTSLQLKSIDAALNLTGNDDLALSYSSTLNSEVTPIWRYLIDYNVSGVIYHGDADFMCDFVSGQWAVKSLNLPRKTEYMPWFVVVDGQEDDGGFVEEYEGLTFLTVKGAGHMVPQWKPLQAFAMLNNYILN